MKRIHFISFLILITFGSCFEKPIDEHPVSVSGIYPHLAMFNEYPSESGVGETGIGAVVPWTGKLWAVTYSAHKPMGSGDKLYEIDTILNMVVRPESIGGTPANRMIHKESKQLILGPYFIDSVGNVRVISYENMPGRHTATARHLVDPEKKVYQLTMEEGLYEVDVHTLEVNQIYEDANARRPGKADAPWIPGYHGKGGYTSQGRLVYSNNGEWGSWGNDYDAGPSGALAEWDGSAWNMVERNQFCEVTGPGGIYGNEDTTDVIWATGWDQKSVLLMLLEEGKWHRFRLPKASHTYDGKHGWHTEWPRIREIDNGRMLMTMHGMFWNFPRSFSVKNNSGIKPLSSYLKIIPDFCFWNKRVVFGCDDASMFDNKFVGQPQSNLWFVDPDHLDQFGPALGFGAVWLNEDLPAKVTSDPFLTNGFNKIMVHLAHISDSPVDFIIEIDERGTNEWVEIRTITLPAKSSTYYIFPEGFESQWVRISVLNKVVGATAYFYTFNAKNKNESSGSSLSSTFPSIGAKRNISFGLVRPAAGEEGRLQFGAKEMDNNGNVKKIGYYEVDEKLNIHQNTENDTIFSWLERTIPIGDHDLIIDEASVLIVDNSGNRYRLPNGTDEISEVWGRTLREVVTERSLLNCAGSFFELPRDISGGIGGIKPICTHNKKIYDFCSWRGMMVISGAISGAEGNGNYYQSDDYKTGLWFGTIDDLWAFGKPKGFGGPWKNSEVSAGEPSDPYLMLGYDNKELKLSHESDEEINFTLEIDVTGQGSWLHFSNVLVGKNQEYTYKFPDGYSAHWIRFKCDKDCRATAQLEYY